MLSKAKPRQIQYLDARLSPLELYIKLSTKKALSSLCMRTTQLVCYSGAMREWMVNDFDDPYEANDSRSFT